MGQDIVQILPENTPFELTQTEIFFLEDETQTLTIAQITAPEMQKKFRSIPQKTPNFGFSKSAFWLKFEVQHPDSGQQIWLEIGYPLLDSLWFYSPAPSGTWAVERTGDHFPFSQRKYGHRNFTFPLQLIDNQTTTFYLRFQSKGTLQLPMWLHTPDSLRLKQVLTESFFAMFYGIMFIMLVYNLFLFFILKNRNYLWYCVLILVNTLAQAGMKGHMLFLWGDWIWWANYSVIFFLYLAMGSLLFFGLNFLNIKEYHKHWYRVFLVLIALTIVMEILSFGILPYSVLALGATATIISSATLLLIVGILSLRQGNQSARFFVWAWTIYLMALLAIAFRNAGLLPDNLLITYGVQIGTVVEVVLLSFALADKINFYRQKTEEAQALALEQSEENARLIREQNEILEKKVHDKTIQLQETVEDLKISNEELFQTQEEIAAQRDLLELNNHELQEYQHRISQNIAAAKLIQNAILPTSTTIQHYFQEHFILYLPKDVVSGDFYWMVEYQKHVIFIEADCTGHGVSGAFMTLISHAIFDYVIRIHHTLEPAEILEKTHTKLMQVLQQKETGNQHGMDLSIVVISEQNEGFRIRFGGAGQKLYYSENQILKTLKGSPKKVGGFFNPKKSFGQQELYLQKGAILYLASDGFIDQNNPIRRKFGSVQFMKLLEKIQFLSFGEQQEILQNTLADFQQNEPQRDDITIVGLRL